MDNPSSHQPNPAEESTAHPDSPASPTLAVNVGSAMPHSSTLTLPVLQSGQHDANEPGPRSSRSLLAEGMHFSGNAWLRGPCTISGTVEGNLTAAADSPISVVITASGRVLGDITAQKISVMGATEGILDAGAGEVALHDTASVRGLVRYGRIQVNGADLNATLERASAVKTS